MFYLSHFLPVVLAVGLEISEHAVRDVTRLFLEEKLRTTRLKCPRAQGGAFTPLFFALLIVITMLLHSVVGTLRETEGRHYICMSKDTHKIGERRLQV